MALYDIFLELQKGIVEGDSIQLGTSEGETMEYYGSVFADDALWVSSSRRGIEVRANVSALFLEFMDIQFNKDKSSVMGVEWQDGKAYDVEKEGWSPMIYDTTEIFGTGEMKLATYVAEREQGSGFFHGKSHISDGVGVPVAKAKLNKGVRWLGYNWSPMLDKDSLKEDLEAMVAKSARQLKETTVSPDSTLYLCDLVIWGRLNYKAHVGVLNRDEMEQLERRIRHIYLDACALQKSVAKMVVRLGS